jgi:hypothetical protein
MQFVFRVLVIGLLARWVAVPWLAKQTQRDALFWLSVPHAFRHFGMVFLVPGVVAEPLPDHFAGPAAYGDLLSAALALIALIMLKASVNGATGMIWLFNTVGTLDLLNALRQAEIVATFGSSWYIPTFFVPVLLVTHFMMFARLLKPVAKADTAAISA